MRGTGGLLCVAVAALLMCCGAYPQLESAAADGTGYSASSEVRQPHKSSGLNMLVQKRNFDEIDQTLMPFPNAKRSYRPYSLSHYNNELSDLGLNMLAQKRNFDEIDQTLMPFPNAKRSYRAYSLNHYDNEMPESSFDKKRFRLDYPIDEIDLSHFPIGSKRSQHGFQALH